MCWFVLGRINPLDSKIVLLIFKKCKIFKIWTNRCQVVRELQFLNISNTLHNVIPWSVSMNHSQVNGIQRTVKS
jgi:hypothetical protein